MFALNRDFPLIQNAHGVAVEFNNDWLKASLDRAARKAGYDGWWLVEEICAAVTQHLLADYGRNVIELTGLEKVVRAVLRDIGYSEIAVRFRTVNPFQRVSLVDCLGTSAGKRRPVFFRRLRERIRTLNVAEVQYVDFCDLQTCSHRLVDDDPVPSWWSGPLMRASIVSFVRERVRALSWKRNLQCTVR